METTPSEQNPTPETPATEIPASQATPVCDVETTASEATEAAAPAQEAAAAAETTTEATAETGSKPATSLALVRGKIAAIQGEQVWIELSVAYEGLDKGVVATSEFSREPRVGSISDFIVDGVNAEGNVILKREKTNPAQQQAELIAHLNEGQLVMAHVTAFNKGGLELEIVGGLRAFMPASQVDIRPVAAEALEGYVGQRFECLVSRIDKGRKVFISRRKRLEAQYAEARTQLLQELQIGSKIEGKVVDVADFGVFVDLGAGLDGMIPLSELAHGFVKNPKADYPVGTEIAAKVIKMDQKKGKPRITLSARAVLDNPFTAVAEKYPVGAELEVTVKRTAPFGAIVEFDDNLEGLIEKDELGWGHIGRVDGVVKTGQKLTAKVLKIDDKKQRVLFSLRQMSENPWQALASVKIGDMVKVTVKTLKDFGAYVQTETGLEGLVPLNRMQKSGRVVEKAGQVFSEGQEVELQLFKKDIKRQLLQFSQVPMKKSEIHPAEKAAAPRQKQKLSGGGLGLGGLDGGLDLGSLDLKKLGKKK